MKSYFINTHFHFVRWVLIVLMVPFILSTCKEKEKKSFKPWDTPMITTYKSNLYISEKANIAIIIQGEIVYRYKNKNVIYPKGIKITNFKENKKVSTLVADSAFFLHPEQKYETFGHVVLNNHEKHTKLETEHLIWDKKSEKIISDTAVKITKDDEIINGLGLTASQDLKKWKITKVTGIIPLKEEVE